VIQIVLNKIEMFFYDVMRPYLISKIVGISKAKVKEYLSELSADKNFLDDVIFRFQKYMTYVPSKYDFSFTKKGGSIFFPGVTLYVLVRCLKPRIIVETGGTPGKSSGFILRGIGVNSIGRLYTFDLPPKVTSENIPSDKIHGLRPCGVETCWAIPEQLKKNYELILGDTKKTLKLHLERLNEIDFFIHDSDHSYQHMMFEFNTAWDHIKIGGLLISDDVFTNKSFQDFSKFIGRKPNYIGNYGIIMK